MSFTGDVLLVAKGVSLDAVLHECTIDGLREAIRSGSTTCEAVTARYLECLRKYNPVLRCAIHISDTALSTARALDLKLEAGETSLGTMPLYGVPIIVKDSYCTSDMPTTAGTLALGGLRSHDAPVIRKLRAAGAIILAKANLHELSLQGCTISSLGGQTLNPYSTVLTPGGSSGGTAAALAANLALVGCGGDTMNSLRSPASACGIVGFRPTTGQVSRVGIVPVSLTQDAIGPMARTVRDARVVFEVMKGADAADPVTIDSRREAVVAEPHRRTRIGVLKNYFPQQTSGDGKVVRDVVQAALTKCSSVGEFVQLDLPELDVATLLAEMDVQKYEFRHCMDDFLLPGGPHGVMSTPHTTLRSIADSGAFDSNAVSEVFYDTLEPGIDMEHPSYLHRLSLIAGLKQTLSSIFSSHDLDALAFPHQRQLPVPIGHMRQPGRNGILAALSGSPAICIPAGFSEPTADATLGVPIGLEIVGKPWQDDRLLDIAEKMEGLIQGRRPPDLTTLSRLPSTDS